MMGAEGSRDGSLEITPERVNGLADQISTATQEFKGQLGHVDDQVRTLLGAGWKGDPGTQFHDAFADWHEGASDVVDGMTLLASAVHEAATGFHVADGR